MRAVSDFKARALEEQHEAFSLITAAYSAAKDARRLELEAETKALGYRPGEKKALPVVSKLQVISSPRASLSGLDTEKG